MSIFPWRAALLVSVFLFYGRVVHAEPVFGVAGVPKSIGLLRDYKRIFDVMKSTGASVFLPTFQYVEQPTSKSLGFESDFFPPCSSTGAAFAALKQSGVKLVVSADVIYPRGEPMPPVASDPFKAIVACAGRDNIYGVLSYDEPVHQGVKEIEVQRVYERLKAIDSTLPVLMVHAPIIADQPKFSTEAARSNYLKAVVRYSRFADMVGFDVYPIPLVVAQVTPPNANGVPAESDAAISGYMTWLKRELPGKRLLMVLQGFAYRDQFEPNFLRSMTDSATIDAMLPPTNAEMTQMTQVAIASGAELVFWWGPSFLGSTSDQAWSAITSAIKAAKAPR